MLVETKILARFMAKGGDVSLDIQVGKSFITLSGPLMNEQVYDYQTLIRSLEANVQEQIC